MTTQAGKVGKKLAIQKQQKRLSKIVKCEIEDRTENVQENRDSKQ